MRPLSTLPRERTAASATPRMVSMNSSGLPKDSTSGPGQRDRHGQADRADDAAGHGGQEGQGQRARAWPFRAIE